MWQDPIVEEVREARERLMQAFGLDVWAIYVHLKALEQSNEHKVVSFAPKRIMPAKLGVENSSGVKVGII